jgi:hypothetical protein
MLSADQIELLCRLNDGWPERLRLEFGGDTPPDISKHPLKGELAALGQGSRASLPFFKDDRVAWFTVAADAEALQAAIEDLRAWILPSFGWEDDRQPLVTPGDAASTLSPLIHTMSPTGYFRWWTTRASFDLVVRKLIAMRRLEEAQPTHVRELVPSLFQLRQQFDVALLTGDRDSAQEAIDSIDHHQLDTAANSRFMQIRLWDQFREYGLIATHPQISEIVQLRMPHPIRLAIVRAFYNQYLARFEGETDVESAARNYSENVDGVLSGLLDACRPTDGVEVLHCIAYKAWARRDGGEAAKLLADYEYPLLERLLAPLQAPPATPPPPEEEFLVALKQGDWRTIQDVGQQLLEAGAHELSTLTPEYLLATLGFSLSLHANPELAEKLRSLAVSQPTIPPTAPQAEPANIAAQSWPEFVERLKANDWEGAGQFLSLEERPSMGTLSITDTARVLESLEEMFTDPELGQSLAGAQLMFGSLPVIIKDFLTDPEFPRASLTGVYRQLFQLWAEQKRGSVSQPDANLLLTLAETVLQLDGTAEHLVGQNLRGWWQARKVRAMLPFLLSALDLLSELTADRALCESLWVEGAEFVRLDPQSLSPGERLLWRSVGTRIGLDDSTIDDFLGVDSASKADAVDPLTEIELQKVAIVSLREEAARNAADVIRQRTNAQVLVVAETHAGPDTENAKTADVVLFVWASTTHAVYRAFDSVREKLAYVQGKGAASIVLTLERWALKQKDLELMN